MEVVLHVATDASKVRATHLGHDRFWPTAFPYFGHDRFWHTTCFGQADFGPGRLWLRPFRFWRSGGLQAAGVSQDSLKAKTSTFEVPTDQNHQNSTRRPPERGKIHEKTSGERKKETRTSPEREKRMKMGGEKEKKREMLGDPAEGGPAKVGPNRPGQTKIELATENPPGHAWPKSAKATRVAKVGPNRPSLDQNRAGQSRSWSK